MATYTSTEIGSIVYNFIDNIPVGISGLLVNGIIVNQQVYYAEQFTGNSIGITAIAEVYQPAVINLTIGNILGLMEAQGMGTKSVSIGELSISKGMKEGASADFKNLGIEQLKEIGQHMSFYQAWS